MRPSKPNITCFKCHPLDLYANDPAFAARTSPIDRHAWKKVKPTNSEPKPDILLLYRIQHVGNRQSSFAKAELEAQCAANRTFLATKHYLSILSINNNNNNNSAARSNSCTIL